MEELVTLGEAADRLGGHVTTIRSWVRAGRLPAYRMGKRFTRVSWPAILAALRPPNADEAASTKYQEPSRSGDSDTARGG